MSDIDIAGAATVRAMNRGLADAFGWILKETAQPGFYKGRLVKDGPYVPVLVFLPCPMNPHSGEPLDRSRRLLCAVFGEVISGDRWPCEKAIPAAEYHYLLAAAAWDRQYAPRAELANPRRPRKRGFDVPPIF